MTLASATLVSGDASPMALAQLVYQPAAPVDNDYLALATRYGVADLATADASVATLISNLSVSRFQPGMPLWDDYLVVELKYGTANLANARLGLQTLFSNLSGTLSWG